MKSISLTDLPTELPSFDVFICSASFEERSVCVARARGKTIADEVIVCIPDHYDGAVASYADELQLLFGGRERIVQFSLSDPLITADNIDKVLFDLADVEHEPKKVLIDITTFTHESLLILFRLLIKYGKHCSLDVTWIYTGAKEYSVGASGKNKWLSRGVREVRSVLGFPGFPSLSTQNSLILLAGFESNRAEAIIQAYNPERIWVGHGIKGDTSMPAYEELNKTFMEHLMFRFPDIEQFTFPLDDPERVRDKLLAIDHELEETNVVIAPMNNKVSTLGAGLAAYKSESIQICYAVALDYNVDNYSKPDSVCYIFQLSQDLFGVGIGDSAATERPRLA